jgi:hypothetical protein
LLYIISPIFVRIIVTFFGESHDLATYTERQKRYFLILTGLIMVLMIGLRKYTNGSGDSEVYYWHWKTLSEIGFSKFFETVNNSAFEKGYTITVFLLSHIFKHPQFVFVFSGLFFSISVCRFVYKNCENLTLAIIVFNSLELFIFMVQGLRQAVAMSICLFAIEKCKKREPFKFAFLIVVAMLFHASAIVFAIVYFLPYLKIKCSHLILFLVGSVVANYSISYLFQFVNLFVRDEYGMIKDAAEGTGVVTILIYIAILLAGLLMRPKDTENLEVIQDYSLYFYLTCIAFVTFSLRSSVASISERISFYFAFGEMALVSNLVQNEKNVVLRFLFSCGVIILCLGVAIHKVGYSSLVPYLFFWQ